MPRHRLIDIDRLVVPLLVAGHIRPGGRVQGVHEVRHGVDLGAAHEPGLAGGRRRVHLQRGVAVPEAGEGDRMLVGGHQQSVIGGVVHAHLVVEVRVGPHPLELQHGRHPPLVDADQLLVQVVEARSGGPQPVLEDRHIAHPPIGPVQVRRRRHGQAHVGAVLLGGQRARAGQAAGVDGGVGEVAPRDDDVVAAGEEGGQELVAGVVVHRLPRRRVLPGGAQFAPGHARDVSGAGRIGEVGLHALAGGVGDLVAVVGVPVVVGQDLEEVGHAAELGDRVEQGARGQAVDLLEAAVRARDDAALLRWRLGVVGRAEGAGAGALGGGQRVDLGDRVRDRPVAAARHRPHLRTGEGADLLDGPVGHASQWLGARRVGHEHEPIMSWTTTACAAVRGCPAPQSLSGCSTTVRWSDSAVPRLERR